MNLEEVSVPRRNVHLFDGHGKYVAGSLSCRVTRLQEANIDVYPGMRIRTDDPYVTNSNLYHMTAIVLDLDNGGSSSPPWAIYRLARTGRRNDAWSARQMLPRDDQYVTVGNYAVLTPNASYLHVQQTAEKALHRCVSPEAKTDPESPVRPTTSKMEQLC